MDKYLFLDIDGVLNSPNWCDRNLEAFHAGTMSMRTHFDSEAVARLDRICKATGCKIVVSSTWRKRKSVEFIREMCQKFGLSPDVKFVGATPNLNSIRGKEIGYWMSENHVRPSQIVILDDDSDMGIFLDRLVKTHRYDGLQDKHVKQAITMLGGKA